MSGAPVFYEAGHCTELSFLHEADGVREAPVAAGDDQSFPSSHQTLHFGRAFTVVRNPKDEPKTGTFHAMCFQLGIKATDLYEGSVMNRFQYPVLLTAADEGGYVVTCRDLPQLVTQGSSEQLLRSYATN